MTHVLSFQTRKPADGPVWLQDYDRSVVDLFRRMMPQPFTLHGYATADIPAATDFTHSLIYDHDIGAVEYSNGTAWFRLQDYDATLAALAAFNTNGFLVQTAADTFAGRTLAAPAAGFSITNPAGTAGNPTFALTNDLAALEALSGTNTIYYRSGVDTWTAVTIGAGLSFSAGTLDRAALTGDATASAGSNAVTVVKINGVSLAGLATGILKNTTTTGAPSIAVAGDFPTLNQNTTGSAATLTTSRNFSITGGGITAAAVGFNGSAAVALSASVDAGHITLARMADMATASLIGRNTAGTGVPEVLAASTVRSLLALVIGTNVQAWDADLDAVASSGIASAWTAYTPTITTGSGSITTLGTVSGRYKQVGKTVFFEVMVAITTNGTGGTSVNATLPATAAAFDYCIVGIEAQATGNLLRGFILASATTVSIKKYDNTYPGADGYRLSLSGVYEAA